VAGFGKQQMVRQSLDLPGFLPDTCQPVLDTAILAEDTAWFFA